MIVARIPILASQITIWAQSVLSRSHHLDPFRKNDPSPRHIPNITFTEEITCKSPTGSRLHIFIHQTIEVSHVQNHGIALRHLYGIVHQILSEQRKKCPTQIVVGATKPCENGGLTLVKMVV